MFLLKTRVTQYLKFSHKDYLFDFISIEAVSRPSETAFIFISPSCFLDFTTNRHSPLKAERSGS